MSRTGIFGGSFDPVHLGHTGIARAAADAAALDEVLFVPAGISPFKAARGARAPGRDRLEMVRLACACDARFVPCDIELRRGGVSWTVDTVREIAASRPGDSLHFIMGEDSLPSLGAWREAQALFRMVEFLVLERPGCAIAVAPQGARVTRFRGNPAAVSSTEIRRRAAAGMDLSGLVAPEVAAYIAARGLYAAGG